MSSTHVNTAISTLSTTLSLSLAVTLVLALRGFPIHTAIATPLLVLAGVRVLTTVRIDQLTTALRALSVAASAVTGVPDVIGGARGGVA